MIDDYIVHTQYRPTQRSVVYLLMPIHWEVPRGLCSRYSTLNIELRPFARFGWDKLLQEMTGLLNARKLIIRISGVKRLCGAPGYCGISSIKALNVLPCGGSQWSKHFAHHINYCKRLVIQDVTEANFKCVCFPLCVLFLNPLGGHVSVGLSTIQLKNFPAPNPRLAGLRVPGIMKRPIINERYYSTLLID